MKYQDIHWKFIREMRDAQNDVTVLYHYTHSRNLANGGTLNPGCTPNSWSRNEFQRCQVPRVFFYTEPKPERMFVGNTVMLTTTVNNGDVYDLNRESSIPREQGESIDSWLEKIKQAGYKGARYNVGFDIVIWFEPIDVMPQVQNDSKE